jgi:hypothetical protein
MKSADYDGMNTPFDRCAAISFLSEIWESRPEKIEENGSDLA